ncbi:MAG: hypothetical protein R3C08_15705 [Hyphomonas sp.]
MEFPGIQGHRFGHLVEHKDQPHEEIADTFMTSFVEDGAIDLHVNDQRRWEEPDTER